MKSHPCYYWSKCL